MSFTIASGVITQSNESSKNITAVTSGGSNKLNLTVASHGYSKLDLVEVSGTASYDGVYIVTTVHTSDLITISDTTINNTTNAFAGTETGTIARGDRDLSGVANLTGVTVETLDSNRKIYKFGNNKLVVEGAMQVAGHRAFKEQMILGIDRHNGGHYLEVKNGGKIFLGRERDGYSDHNETVWYEKGYNKNVNNSNPGLDSNTLEVESGGGFYFLSGICDCWGMWVFKSGSTLQIGIKDSPVKPIMDFTRCWRSGDHANFHRSFTTDTNIYGLIFLSAQDLEQSSSALGGTLSDGCTWQQLAPPNVFEGYEPRWLSTAFAGSSNLPTGTYDIVNYGGGFQTDIDIQKKCTGTVDWYFTNCAVGTNINVLEDNRGTFNLYIRQDLSLTVTTPTGTPINGVKAYIKDNEGTPYSATTNASGLASFSNIIIGDSLDGTGSVDAFFDSGDIATVRVITYLESLGVLTAPLLGVGGSEASTLLVIDLLITETDKSIVDDYDAIDTPQKFYDRAKAYLYDNYAGEASTIVARSGNEIDLGSYDLVIDATASSAFAISGTTITIKATTFTGDLTTTGTITLSNGASVVGQYTDSSGTNIILSWSLTNVEATSRVQLFNTTKAANNPSLEPFVNVKLTGTPTDFTTATGTYISNDVSEGDNIRIRVTCAAGTTALLPFETNVVATSVGIVARANQQADAVYNSNNIDGNNITGVSLTTDTNNVTQIEIEDTTSPYTVSVQQLYNYFAVLQTTEDGINKYYNAITAIDQMNYTINTAHVDLKFENIGTTDVNIVGGRMYRDNDTTIVYTDPNVTGRGTLTHDTGFLLQFIQPQVESALGNSVASATDMASVKADVASIKPNTNLIPALL